MSNVGGESASVEEKADVDWLILPLYLRPFNDISRTNGWVMLNNELEKCGEKRIVRRICCRPAAVHDVSVEFITIKAAVVQTRDSVYLCSYMHIFQ
jgi:predicted metalloprotease